MKFYLFIIAMLFFYSGCLSQEIDKQANEQYRSFINQRLFMYKGDTYIFKDQKISMDNSEYFVLYQVKGLSSNLVKLPFSEIESLNGYEWKGMINIQARATRNLSWSSSYDSGIEKQTWREWYTFDSIILTLIKKRGLWRIIEADSIGLFELNTIPTSQVIDQALLRPMEDLR
ncbi:hypothetical protein [Spirosoma lituiforme]